jgi:hypothetical protein
VFVAFTEEQRAALKDAKEDWIDDFHDFLMHTPHGRQGKTVSEDNARSVIRQTEKLASGSGITYHHWAEGVYFAEGEEVDLQSDFVELYQRAEEMELEEGRDLGNGWLLRHPIMKLQCYQLHLLGDCDDDHDDDCDDAPSSPTEKTPKATSKATSPNSTAVNVAGEATSPQRKRNASKTKGVKGGTKIGTKTGTKDGVGSTKRSLGINLVAGSSSNVQFRVGHSVLAMWNDKWLTAKITRVEDGDDGDDGKEYEVKRQGATWIVAKDELRLQGGSKIKEAVGVEAAGAEAPKSRKKRRTAVDTAPAVEVNGYSPAVEVCFVCGAVEPEYNSTEVDQKRAPVVPVCGVECEAKYLTKRGISPEQ